VGIGWESAGPNMTAMLQSRDEERENGLVDGTYGRPQRQKKEYYITTD
jgi:hypothetical protein